MSQTSYSFHRNENSAENPISKERKSRKIIRAHLNGARKVEHDLPNKSNKKSREKRKQISLKSTEPPLKFAGNLRESRKYIIENKASDYFIRKEELSHPKTLHEFSVMPDFDREDQPDSKRNYSLFTRLFSLESLTNEADLSVKFHRMQEGDDPWMAFSLEAMLVDDINEAKDLCDDDKIKDEDSNIVEDSFVDDDVNMTELLPEPEKGYEPSMVDSAYGSQASSFFSSDISDVKQSSTSCSLPLDSDVQLQHDELNKDEGIGENLSEAQLNESDDSDAKKLSEDQHESNKSEIDRKNRDDNPNESEIKMDESALDESSLSSSKLLSSTQMFESPDILSSTQIEESPERTALPQILSCITIPPPLSSNERDECIDSPDFIEPLHRSELPAYMKKALDVENGESALLEETLRPLNITFVDRRSSMDNESGIGSSALSGEEKKNTFYDPVNNRIVGDIKLSLMDPKFNYSLKTPSQLTEREQRLLCPRVILFDIFSFVNFKGAPANFPINYKFNVSGRLSSCDSRSPSPMSLSAFKSTVVVNDVVIKPRKSVVSFMVF